MEEGRAVEKDGQPPKLMDGRCRRKDLSAANGVWLRFTSV